MDSKVTWPGWETVRVIGHGSFGTVYEIERDLQGDIEKCALKHISIPKSETEIREMKSEGLDAQSITQSFADQVKDIVNEYKLMAGLNDCPNIVSCHDVDFIQKDDGFGWDIYIRMELLTPLMDLLAEQRNWPEEETVRLGRDICNALVACKQKSIIHRDIKPDNIFVSKDRKYKLGDFGIAKIAEKTSSATSRIGTYTFMAPEVYNGENYGDGADIYSLGMVLYWLLNDRKAPFVSVNTKSEKEAAQRRRFNGEQIPAPAHGSEGLKRIVMKACAFDPKDRYQNAEEMLRDIDRLDRSSNGEAGAIAEKHGKPGHGSGPTDAPDEDNTVGAWKTDKHEQKAETQETDENGTVGAFNTISCPRCGKKMKRGTKFCTECGASIESEQKKEEDNKNKEIKQTERTDKDEERNTTKNNSKWVFIALAVLGLLLIVLLSRSCGDSAGSSPTPTTKPASISTPTPTPASDNTQTEHQHEWGGWIVETPAGCETPGVEVRTCILDQSHQERRAIPATGHDWVEATTTAPKTCRNCGLTEGERLKTSYEILAEKCKAYDSGIELPLESEMLSQTVTRYVKGANKNGGIYLCRLAGGTDPIPNTKSPLVLRNYTPLTVYAVRGTWTNGHALVETPTGQMGWVRLDRTSETNDFTY